MTKKKVALGSYPLTLVSYDETTGGYQVTIADHEGFIFHGVVTACDEGCNNGGRVDLRK